MRIGGKVDLGALAPAEVAKKQRAFAAAIEAGVEEATTRTKEHGRAALLVGFRGSRRVATILRGDFFRAHGGKPPTGYVYSAWFKRGQDILAAFATGATITGRAGRRLLVPADQAPGAKLKARVALELVGSAPRIAIIRTAAGKLLLVEHNARQTTVLGFLVRSVKMPKRFDAAALPRFAERVLGERLEANLAAKGF